MEICSVQVLSNYLLWNFDAMTRIPLFYIVLWTMELIMMYWYRK